MSASPMSHDAVTPAVLFEGGFVGTHTTTGVQVAHDWVSIRRESDRIVSDSKHTVYGPGVPVQSVRLVSDLDWSPLRAEVEAAGMGQVLVVDFEDLAANAVAKTPSGEQKQRFPLERRSAWFTISGALYFPLHLVRRFDFSSGRPQQFSVFPMGTVEVRKDSREQATSGTRLFMRLALGSYQDEAVLDLSEAGELVRYQLRGQGLLVEQERR
jgi:hypothetical protein